MVHLHVYRLPLLRLLFSVILFHIHMIVNDASSCYDRKVTYARLTNCIGKTSLNYILSTTDRVTRVECATRCEEMYQCMVIFYNSGTRSCSLHNRTVSDIGMTLDVSSTCFMADDVAESWIEEIIKVTSSHSLHPATGLIGPLDGKRWVQQNSYTEDFVVVRFSMEMYMEQVHIYEMYGLGGVNGISLLDPDGSWNQVWSTDDIEGDYIGGTRQILSLDLNITHFKTATVRINIGIIDMNECIEAVKVRGKRHRPIMRVQDP